MAPKLRLTLVAIGTVGIAAGTVLLAHAYRARKRQMTL
jgi:hypothetical protein